MRESRVCFLRNIAAHLINVCCVGNNDDSWSFGLVLLFDRETWLVFNRAKWDFDF